MDFATIILIITTTISVASAITRTLPTPAQGSRWAAVYRFVEGLALVNDRVKERPELVTAAQDLVRTVQNVRGTGANAAVKAALRVYELAR